METLEGRLRSLEDLIKSSVTAKTTSPPPPPAPAQRQEQSSDNMTTSLTAHSDPPSLGTTQSNPWPTADSIPDDGTFGNTATSQQPCDLSQYWQNSETSPSFEMPSSAVLDPTEIDLRPQVRVKGIKKCSLPPPQGGLFLLQEYLADFNTAVPLFDAESISTVFLDCYDGRADGVPITWVTVKIVLAIAHRLRAMSPLGVAQDTENVQTYLEESMAEIPGLLLTKPSLLLAQCYLGMGILLSTSSHPQHAAMLVSMSLHMLQELHVNDPPPLGDGAVPGDANQQQQQQQQLQRVFWIAYSMDADISLRAGRLPTLSSRLVNVELPAEQMHDSQGEIRAAEGDFKVNVFRLRAQLALIQAQLMECVLAPRMFEAEHSHKVLLQSLVAGLEQWRANRLFELSIDNFQHLLHRSDLFHIIVLESAYLATAFTARVHLSLGTRLSVYPFGTDGLNAVLSTVAMGDLYDEARRFIGILNLLPADGLPCNW